jgi:cytochrome P450 family 109
VPTEDNERFKDWSDKLVETLGSGLLAAPDRETFLRNEKILEELGDYFSSLVELRRREPREDLLTGLALAELEGSKLSFGELLQMLVLLLVAGNETTTNLIGNSAYHLMRNPEQWRKLVAEPGLDRIAIEESLRYDAPIQGFFRNTKQGLEVAGATIPKGAKVMLLYGAANRDPRKFERPDEYRIDRNPTEHIAFGFGPHTCLGAHLARMEARALLVRALQKVRRMELEAEPVRTQNPLLRGMQTLKVRIDAR